MITITNIAKNKLKELITTNTGRAAYLYLKSGGCNGFNYTFSVLNEDKKPDKIDERYEIDKKYNLYICGKSLMYVIGTRIDFTNDKIMGKCGCGVSVNF